LRWLHFYPGQVAAVQKGSELRLKGEVRRVFYGLEIVHPQLRSTKKPLAQTLTPVYPTTSVLSQHHLSPALPAALQRADRQDSLSDERRERYQLLPFKTAILFLHPPPKEVPLEPLLDKTHPAWMRVQFDELLAQQLALAQARARRRQLRGPAFPAAKGALLRALEQSLPFALTQ